VGHAWHIFGANAISGKLTYAMVKETNIRGQIESVGGNIKGVPVPSLASLRIRAGLSQGELAERAGVGRNTISRLEHGANARFDTIDKLAAALGTMRARLIKPPRQSSLGFQRSDKS
jgi:DNA-binding XRE family transcriptional regulator